MILKIRIRFDSKERTHPSSFLYLLSTPEVDFLEAASTTVSTVSSLPLLHPIPWSSLSSLKSLSLSSSLLPSVEADNVVVQLTSLMVLRVLDSWEAVGLWPLVMGVYTILFGLDIILNSSL